MTNKRTDIETAFLLREIYSLPVASRYGELIMSKKRLREISNRGALSKVFLRDLGETLIGEYGIVLILLGDSIALIKEDTVKKYRRPKAKLIRTCVENVVSSRRYKNFRLRSGL